VGASKGNYENIVITTEAGLVAKYQNHFTHLWTVRTAARAPLVPSPPQRRHLTARACVRTTRTLWPERRYCAARSPAVGRLHFVGEMNVLAPVPSAYFMCKRAADCMLVYLTETLKKES
jgi:hypothetical protein